MQISAVDCVHVQTTAKHILPSIFALRTNEYSFSEKLHGFVILLLPKRDFKSIKKNET